MEQLKAAVLRATLLVSIGLIALAAICTITVLGILSLLSALNAAATVYVGSTWASILVGLLCLTPVLLAIFAILHVYRRAAQNIRENSDESDADSSANNAIINLIKGNPWEAASIAFLFGFTYNSDPKLRALIMHEGLDKLRATQTPNSESTHSD